MKAAVLKETGTIDDKDRLIISEIETPAPKPNEVLVKVECCGVCHTDLHQIEGELAMKNKVCIPGHQAVGTIEAVGNKVRDLKVGDRVGSTWLFSSCGKCEYCQRNEENLCENAKFTGWDSLGGYAEYFVIPADYAVKIPDNVSSEHAAPLLCAGVIGLRSLKQSEVKMGENLGLYGFGASAHIAIQIAHAWHCRVFVFTRGELHKKHAKEMDAVWVGETTDTPPELMDSSVIFAPVGTIVHDALHHLKRGGTVAINSIHMTNIPELEYSQLYYEKTIRSVSNLTRQDAADLMELMKEINIKTHIETYKLQEANGVLRKLKNSQINGAAVLTMEE